MTNYVSNSRAFTTTVDKYGIDPLLNKALDEISNISTYSLYDVKEYQQGRPDSVAHEVYGEQHLWWVILYYNKLLSFRQLKKGLTLNIPDYASVTRILANNAAKNYGARIRTVTI